jgi:outer membrane protein assembly factor BamB
MPHKLACVCMLLALGVPTALGEADYVDSSALNEAGLVKFWQLRLALEKGQEIADAYLVDDQIYLATRDGYIYAIHAHTGTNRWKKRVITAGYQIRRPCHAGDRTIFVTPPAITQYDRYTGQPIRRMETRFPTGSAAISDGMYLYVGGIDQQIYAFALDQDFERWKARAGGQILSRPALLGKHLYFAGDDGSVYACVAEDKRFYWRTRTTGSITADLAVDDNGVYVATRDNALYSLAPQDGGRRWRTRFSGPLYEPPVVTPEVVFQYCPEDGVAAINAGTVGVEKRVRWVLPRGRQLLTLDEHLAYVLSRDESILIAKLDDGKIVHTVPAPGFTMPMPSPSDRALYIASKDGRLFCARQRGAPPLQAEDVRAAMQRPGEPEGQETGAGGETAEAPAVEEDHLKSTRPGPPIGGKSKVSKEYAGE